MKSKFHKSENHSENYLATIVKIDKLTKHPYADRLQMFPYLGRSIITDMKAQVGDIMIYFVIESAINIDFLKEHNLLRDKTLNKDPEVGGFFENKGRVRAQPLVKVHSEGFIIPLKSLEFITGEISDKEAEELVGTEFDMVDDFQLCKKYVIKAEKQPGMSGGKKTKEGRLKELLIENQFNFHTETSHLDKNLHKIEPDDEIIITNKTHGSSGIISYTQIVRKLSLLERIAKYFGVSVHETEYGYIYSSGKPKSRLPKGIITEGQQSTQKYVNPNGDFYEGDIWKKLFTDYKHVLSKGLSIYGEIVGFDEKGGCIQGGYDYGCNPNEYKFQVYKITVTSPDGNVYVLSWDQTKEFCKLKGLEFVEEFYQGKAKDLFPELSVDNHWSEDFLQKLKDKFLEGDCHICVNKVPAEGVVLRKGGNLFDFEVFKLKSKRFNERESKMLDTGVIDIESAESLDEN